ncbi:MAG: hypothetical protein ABI745_01795 [Caldimonas sp.]
MASRPWQWLVFFFTRPIRLSDLSALAARMSPKRRRAAEPLPPAAASAAPIEVPRARSTLPSERPALRVQAKPKGAASMFRPELGIGVSEQPFDTLPAELRDELQRPGSGRIHEGLRDG